MFSALACVTDVAQLSCPDGRTINATSAVYGQYIYPHGFACPNDCCPPNPAHDCTELVYDNSPQDWLAIKLLCDEQESCEFPYSGAGFRTSCDEGVTPAYVHVFYNCLPRKNFNASVPRILTLLALCGALVFTVHVPHNRISSSYLAFRVMLEQILQFLVQKA